MKIERFTAVLLILLFSLMMATLPLAFARGAQAEQALAPTVTCNVPSDRPLIETALADLSCDPITIKGGRFHETLVVTRDVTIVGAQNGATIIDGDGNGTVFRLEPGVSATMERLTVTDGGEGAIRVDVGASLTLSDVVVAENSSSGNGGGITNLGTMTLTRSTVRDNVAAGSGGGIANDGGRVMLADSTVAENVAGDRGGGVFNAGGVLSVTRSTVSTNTAAYGAGFFQLAFSAPGPSWIENSTLSANTAITSGGGIFVEDGTLLVTNGTLFGNGAATGGGIFRNDMSAMPGSATVSNTIIAGSGAGSDCAGTVASNDYNLAGDGSCTSFAKPNDLTNTDPLLGPLQHNGGGTQTHATLPGSPALEAGSCMLPVDQRGVARPVGNVCDIGAFENEGPFGRYLPVAFGGG